MSNLPVASSIGYRRGVFAICFLSGMFSGLASTLAPSYLPSITAGLAPAHAEEAGAFINASFIYGMLVGGIALGYYSDRAGRRLGLLVAVGCMAVFLLLSSVAPSWQWLTACRFFTGFGVGAVLLITAVLIAEVWPPKQKAIALGILSVSFPIGIFSAGLITYNVVQWREAFWVGVLPLLLLIIVAIIVKESPEWKRQPAVIQQNTDRANGNITANILKGSLIYGTMLIGLWAVFAWLPSWVQSVVTITDAQKERGISMMIFAGGGISGGLVSGWLGNRIGLRNAMLICFVGCFFTSLLLFKFTGSFSTISFLLMALMAVLFGISQGILNAYIPGLFSTAQRSTATGICFNISRVFTATVVFFIGWLVSALGGYGNALFSFSWVFLTGAVVMLFTKNRSYASY